MTNIKALNPNESFKSKSTKYLFLLYLLMIHLSFVIWVLSLSIPCCADGKVKILKVETSKIGNYSEVSVYASDNIKPEIILLESPNRIALAFSNAIIDNPVTLGGPSPLIKIVQAAQFDENTVYVMIEPNDMLTYEYASIIGKNKFILEFTKAKPGATKIIIPSISYTEEQKKPPTAEVPEVEKPLIAATMEALPVLETITKEIVISAETVKPKQKMRNIEISKIPLPLQGRTIVVDPGHGGHDPGYVGKSGIFEKFLNLKIALKLKKLLADAGAKVIMTRTKDVSIRNKEVVNITNKNNADIFIAIHLNCYPNPRIGGSETYYFNPQSKKFAAVMQRALCNTIKSRNRGVKKQTYYIIHHAKMPSILVESAYLTNPREEKLILTPKYQSQVAYGMYKGIKEYVRISSWQRSPK